MKKRHTQTHEHPCPRNNGDISQLDKRLDRLSEDIDRLKIVIDKIEDRVLSSQESINRMIRAEEELEDIVRKTCNDGNDKEEKQK